MNKLINSFCYRMMPLLKKKVNRHVNVCFSNVDDKPTFSNMKHTYSCEQIIEHLDYKDETWNLIKNISYLMWNDLFKWQILKQYNTEFFKDNECNNTKVEYNNSEIHCNSKGIKNDWIFLKLTLPLPESYMIEFSAKIKTIMSEFQFAFNYKNIGERYRFNLVNNEVLNFEVVYGGFFHKLSSTPISLMLDIYYNFKIYISKNSFSYLVDDKVILTIKQHKPLIQGGQLVFILWDSDTSNISAIIKNINIYAN